MNKVSVVMITLVLSTALTTSAYADSHSMTSNVSPQSVMPDYTFGAPLPDGPGLSEFDGITSTWDLLARLIYAEAMGESNAGKRGVAYVVSNRVNKNLAEFGGDTFKGVILKSPGGFVGMTTLAARQPNTSSAAWTEALNIASTMGQTTNPNPIGTCLWFNTNAVYSQNSTYNSSLGVDFYKFPSTTSFKQVVEKTVIGNHTFFRVGGY